MGNFAHDWLIKKSHKMGSYSQLFDFVDGIFGASYYFSMRSKTQEKLLQLLLSALKPLVHLLLEVGIGHREFAEVAKRAYVDVATEKYGIRGRKTNISRVAVMTGLTRKEVKRIRESDDESWQSEKVKPVPASVVLQHWVMDKDFVDEQGEPLVLPFSGVTPSFSDLVKEYAGDIPPGALRTELIRSGAVEELDDGMLKLLRRTFRFIDSEAQLFWCFDRCLAGATSNITHNYLYKQGRVGGKKSWPNRVSEALRVRASDVPQLREFVRDCATRFTVEIDEHLTSYETSDDFDGEPLKDLFTGIIYHEVDR